MGGQTGFGPEFGSKYPMVNRRILGFIPKPNPVLNEGQEPFNSDSRDINASSSIRRLAYRRI